MGLLRFLHKGFGDLVGRGSREHTSFLGLDVEWPLTGLAGAFDGRIGAFLAPNDIDVFAPVGDWTTGRFDVDTARATFQARDNLSRKTAHTVGHLRITAEAVDNFDIAQLGEVEAMTGWITIHLAI